MELIIHCVARDAAEPYIMSSGYTSPTNTAKNLKPVNYETFVPSRQSKFTARKKRIFTL
jgi:hypothetical protein